MIIVTLILFIVPGVISTAIYVKLKKKERPFKSLFVIWLIFSFIIYTVSFSFIYVSSMNDGFIAKVSTLAQLIFVSEDVRIVTGEAVSALSEGIVFIFALIRRWCISALVSSVSLPLLYVAAKMFFDKKIVNKEKSE